MRGGRYLAAALLMTGLMTPLAFAETGKIPGDDQYVPRLADLMNNVQLRHTKLWFAGAASNWELAAFEIRRLTDSLVEAATLYPGIPVTNVTTMADPVQAVAAAIEAKDGKKFASAYDELTAGCNGCHQSAGRGFIVMRRPTASPFSDQVFSRTNSSAADKPR
jgi:hypothetical protein